MSDWREHAQSSCVADQYIQPAKTFVKSSAEFVDRRKLRKVEWNEGCLTANRLDCIVDLFKAAYGPRDEDKMGTFFCEAPCNCGTQSTACTGYQRDAPLQPTFF